MQLPEIRQELEAAFGAYKESPDLKSEILDNTSKKLSSMVSPIPRSSLVEKIILAIVLTGVSCLGVGYFSSWAFTAIFPQNPHMSLVPPQSSFHVLVRDPRLKTLSSKLQQSVNYFFWDQGDTTANEQTASNALSPYTDSWGNASIHVKHHLSALEQDYITNAKNYIDYLQPIEDPSSENNIGGSLNTTEQDVIRNDIGLLSVSAQHLNEKAN